MLVRDGHIVALDAHLARLRESVHGLYGLDLDPGLESRLRAAAAPASPRESAPPLAAARLRVVVTPDGAAHITTAPAGAPAPLHLQPIVVPGGLGAHKWADRAPVAAFESPGVAALICDADGTVLEASSANVWALLDGCSSRRPPTGGFCPASPASGCSVAALSRPSRLTTCSGRRRSS